MDIAAETIKHVLDVHGTNAYGVKTFSYGYMENTYAITKYALRHMCGRRTSRSTIRRRM